MGDRRDDVVVVVPLLAVKAPMDHVGTQLVVLFLAMMFPHLHSTPPDRSFHIVKMVARWGTVAVGLALPWAMKEITQRGGAANQIPYSKFQKPG
jgi:hypothetical protein